MSVVTTKNRLRVVIRADLSFGAGWLIESAWIGSRQDYRENSCIVQPKSSSLNCSHRNAGGCMFYAQTIGPKHESGNNMLHALCPPRHQGLFFLSSRNPSQRGCPKRTTRIISYLSKRNLSHSVIPAQAGIQGARRDCCVDLKKTHMPKLNGVIKGHSCHFISLGSTSAGVSPGVLILSVVDNSMK